MPDQILVEDQFGHGAQTDALDVRDFIYDEVAVLAPIAPNQTIDWERGYDVRDTLGGDIEIKNQQRSMSCVGQGISYLEWIQEISLLCQKYGMSLDDLRITHAQEVATISAKAIYSQISLGFLGGADIRTGIMLGLHWGAVFEALVPSQRPNGTTDESWMVDKTWESPQITKLASALEGKNARVIQACDNMNLFALAIQNNLGVVGGVVGSNGRGWGSAESPLPPAAGDILWQHCLFYGAFGTDAHGKFIATPNSWGQIVARPQGDWQPGFPPGYGWQKIRANYFTKALQFNPWTYTEALNEVTMPTPPDPLPATFAYTFTVPIFYGSKNEQVVALQTALACLGYLARTNVTGYFGPFTAAALLHFQLANNVASPGVLTKLGGRSCGPATIAALNKISTFNL